ncbi:MAG: S-adenosylmethionine:tRNA ribosyltransferase-isomerase [Caldilineaceae bacterium]
MQRTDLFFERPSALQATTPPEVRQVERDEVRLMVTTPAGHTHTTFTHLADFLEPGDLVVVNRSATLPASLPVTGAPGAFLLNLSTHYGDGVWLAEPRWNTSEPGPLPLNPGETVEIDGASIRLVAPYPGLLRLWFVHTEADLCRLMTAKGTPIRYGYVTERYPLSAYQTLFAKVLGQRRDALGRAALTKRVVQSLRRRGPNWRGSIRTQGSPAWKWKRETVEAHPMYAEPFEVPVATAYLVNATRQAGHRDRRRHHGCAGVGIGLMENRCSRAVAFTCLFVHPAHGTHVADGLITGFHDPASHLAMLYMHCRPSRNPGQLP